MAEPLRQDLPDQQPHPAGQFNIHRYENQQRSGPGRWWFWILVIVVVVWFVVWGRGSGHKATSAVSVPVPASVPAPQNTVDVMTLASHPEQYVGKQVHLRDVLVQSVNGDASVFVGSGSTEQVLVIVKQGAVTKSLQGKPNPIPQGGVLDVTGTVQKPSSVENLERDAKITHKEAEAVMQQGIVIEADRVDPQPV